MARQAVTDLNQPLSPLGAGSLPPRHCGYLCAGAALTACEDFVPSTIRGAPLELLRGDPIACCET